MNKKYLKENNLYDAHKQFMRLCEWSYTPTLDEDDDDEQDMPQNGGQDTSMDGGNMPQGGGQDQMMDGDMPQGGGQDTSMDGGNMPQGGGQDQMMDGDIPQGGGQDQMMDGDIPQGGGQDPMMDGDMPMDDEPEEEDDVIDVDDLTDAQEKVNDKVNSVGRNLGQVDDKIESLMKALSKMEIMIDNNNNEIANFKKEFEKRNPTQTEKLNLRSLDSYPFNVNPKDYWEKKGIDPNSNYEGYSDNNEPTTDEYEITNSDVDDYSDKEIEDSFKIDDDLNQDIKKIFEL